MASATDKPVIVLIPGLASVGSIVYAPLVEALVKNGWDKKDLIAINNPSVDTIATNADIKPTALDADIRRVRAALAKAIEEEGRDVLLVGHSYGGAVTVSAADGFWKHSRAGEGKKGGVLKAGLISAAVPLPGGSVAADRMSWLQANNLPGDEGGQMDMIDGEAYLIPTGFENFWMNDIDNETYRSSLRPVALGCAMTPIKEHIKPNDWKIAYLKLVELDLAMPEAFQDFLIDRARKAGAQIETQKLKAGHFAQISRPKEVADWIVGLL